MTQAAAAELQAPAGLAAGGSRLPRVLAVVSVTALWFLCRPYLGVDGDARLYVGRVLADMDPHGLGLDTAFAHDGQSRFSLFPHLLAPAIGALGVGSGAMAVSAAGLVLWLGAAALLLSRLFQGRLLWASLVCVAVFPAAYGGFAMFEWGEASATPRVFAEAAGLSALAALLAGRRVLALLLVLVGGLLHPIMIAPAVGAGLLFLAQGDRRWLAVAGLVLAGVAAAAWIGLPPADRLLKPFDPAWLGIVADRSPQVLPALWPSRYWGVAACQSATLVLAWSLAEERLRRIVAAVACVALAGTALAALAPTQLVVQLQPWRAQWLASFMAAAVFAACARGLWRRNDAGRVALALLAVAWLGRDNLAVACGAGAAALALRFGLAPAAFDRRWVAAAWGLAGLFAAVSLGSRTLTVAQAFAPLPADYLWSPATWLRVGLHTTILGGLAAAAAIGLPDRFAWRRVAAPSALALVLLAALSWDDRPAVVRAREGPDRAPALRAALADGSVYWLDGSGTNWLWTGRPEWWSQTQGAGVVFDRDLAVIWRQRLERLIDAGLLTPADRHIYLERRKADPAVSHVALSRLCALPDGPRWVVADVSRVEAALRADAALRWRAPAPEFQQAADGHGILAAQDYLVFDCARARPGPLRSAREPLHALKDDGHEGPRHDASPVPS